MSWYRTGTVAVTNGSKNIVGVDTLWSTQASVGDIFTLIGTNLYEVETIADDTHIGLKTAYAEASGSAQAYAIVRNFTSTTPSVLAQKLADMLGKWHVTLDQLLSWETSVAATVPLTNPGTGVTTQVKPIAGLIADIGLKAPLASPVFSGNVGIGCAPTYKLDVQSTGSPRIRCTSTDGGYAILDLTSAGVYSWTLEGGSVLNLKRDGTPQVTFDAAGGILARGDILITSTALLGYGVGAGGTVTQATSKSTTVVLNKPSGVITMHPAALAAGAEVAFTVNNVLMSATDVVYPQITWGASLSYRVECIYSGPGGFVLVVKNTSAGSLAEAVTINFAIIKGAAS